jgi:hypothetical protein
VSRIKLRSGDIALLERLNFVPLEIGDLPVDSVARLTALGLVSKELGCCEITRKGQLTLHRQHFLKASSRRIARVTRRNPVFLQEESLSTSLSRTRLSEHLNMRRRVDARVRQATKLPKWLMRLASETAGRFRPVDEVHSEAAGIVNSKLNHEAH